METGAGALDGVIVVDLTQHLSGPYCTQLLADQGATVVKVEPPSGDSIRHAGPFHADDPLQAYGGYFQSVNRNKLGIAVDLKNLEGVSVFKELVRQADVVVENYRAGVMERLGLSYDVLREINPRLVYATVRGFGDPRSGRSPYSDWPSYDVVAQAFGGIIGITGDDPEHPAKVGPGVGDIFPGTLTTVGILSALYRAQKTGQGQFVDVGMADAILALCERIVYQHSYQGRVPAQEGRIHPVFSPFGMFPTKDGFVTIAGHLDASWAILTREMGQPELACDARFCDRHARVRNNHLVYEVVSAWTSRHTKKELLGILGGKVPFGPVYNIAEIFDDPHFKARRMLVPVEQPGIEAKVVIANTPIHMSGTPGGVRHRAPLLGEHTDDVLGRFGFSPAEIDTLRECGAVK
ncbi:CaiB/BaiF CoA transferase family protein [Chelativorans alearense]|uniref:CaiB/BaiF CoA transferase family protein n=1 Tax=Chelativorans alearense TaxID=2681495 RepID=UPI0013D5CE6F|nr:CoA transferase [Chelativorans alearense]